MNAPEGVVAIASPLYTAPLAELLATTNACVPPDHAEMVPSSLAKIKRAVPCEGITKPLVGLNTMPVGAPGTDTTSPSFAPVLPLYNVDFPVPLSATHHGLVALATRPQALTRSGSVRSAETAPSETRLCCL